MSSRAPFAVALAAVTLALGAAQPAAAAPPAWHDLSVAIAAPWPGLQSKSGHFGDYVRDRAGGAGRDDYGDALLGYALIQTGIREGEDRLVRSGLRAVTYAAKHPSSEAIRMYQSLGLASAYNLARKKLADDERFRQVRGTWAKRLRRIRVLTLNDGRVVWSHAMAEAVAVLELTRTGLHSSDPDAVLHDAKAAARRARRLFNHDMPDAAEQSDRDDPRAGHTAILGEFTRGLPIAYHALGLGMLARGVELMGPKASGRARSTLRAAAAASWALQSPDGDVAYFGRSQVQSWTLGLTAYGTSVAGGAEGASVAARAVERLANEYPVRDKLGLMITPALARNLGGGIRGLDEYVAAVSYNGLTLTALNWAIAAAGADTGGTTGADAEGSFVLGDGQTAFATVRRGDVWFAVKKARTEPGDLRYDFGLVALKVRDDGGGWHDAMPIRPITHGDADTAGPVIDGRAPQGDTIRVGSAGKVTVRDDDRRFEFQPTSCGVRLSFPAGRGQRVDYSVFFRRRRADRDGTKLTGPDEELAANSAFNATFEDGYSSGADPRLTRARLQFRPKQSRDLKIAICRPG